LRDAQWEKSKDLLPGREGTVGVTAKENRVCIDAVISRYRAGMPWRDQPDRFGAWNNIARRHRRWAASGVWHSIFAHLAAEADNADARIDATIVRAPHHAAGATGGTRSRRASAGRKGD
jgi:transposase